MLKLFRSHLSLWSHLVKQEKPDTDFYLVIDTWKQLVTGVTSWQHVQFDQHGIKGQHTNFCFGWSQFTK